MSAWHLPHEIALPRRIHCLRADSGPRVARHSLDSAGCPVGCAGAQLERWNSLRNGHPSSTRWPSPGKTPRQSYIRNPLRELDGLVGPLSLQLAWVTGSLDSRRAVNALLSRLPRSAFPVKCRACSGLTFPLVFPFPGPRRFGSSVSSSSRTGSSARHHSTPLGRKNPANSTILTLPRAIGQPSARQLQHQPKVCEPGFQIR